MKRTEHSFSASQKPEEIIAREEKRYWDGIEEAAEMTVQKNARFIFLAGPSCSGKTTTSLGLIESLRKRGLRVFAFSTDDFFFNEEQAGRFADGMPDYDAFSHTDSAYIRRVLAGLARKETVVLPTFDFLNGRRAEETITVDPTRYDVTILEGIHALNDRILEGLPPEEERVCLYLNTTCGVRMEEEDEGLTPEEVRLCRRIIRDHKHRGADAERSFSLWVHVRESEKEILTPFRKNAQIVLSTDFSYEPAVARDEVTRRLSEVAPSSRWYDSAQKLTAKLEKFPRLSEDLVPKNSVLQEFLAD